MKNKMILMLLVLSFGLSGCVSGSKTGAGLGITFFSQSTEGDTSKSIPEREGIIKSGILEIEGVTDAAVIISGRTALIGIAVETDNNEEISRLKTEAVKFVRAADDGVNSISVTANEEIMRMIKELED